MQRSKQQTKLCIIDSIQRKPALKMKASSTINFEIKIQRRAYVGCSKREYFLNGNNLEIEKWFRFFSAVAFLNENTFSNRLLRTVIKKKNSKRKNGRGIESFPLSLRFDLCAFICCAKMHFPHTEFTIFILKESPQNQKAKRKREKKSADKRVFYLSFYLKVTHTHILLDFSLFAEKFSALTLWPTNKRWSKCNNSISRFSNFCHDL